MINFLKLNVVVLYALAIAGLITPLPFDLGPLLRNIVGIMLAIHVAEIIIARKAHSHYAGGSFDSIMLGLLFGVLHFRPLLRRIKRVAA